MYKLTKTQMLKDAVYALEMRQLLLSEDLHPLKLHAMHLIHNHFCYPLITLIILPPLVAPCHCGHFMTGMSSFLPQKFHTDGIKQILRN